MTATTTQSSKDITSKITTESTMLVTSSSYTAKITEDFIGTAPAPTTFTTDMSASETTNTRGSTISSPASIVSTKLILVSKPLTEETSASDTVDSTVSESVSTASTISESNGTHRNNTQPGITEITRTVTENASEETSDKGPTLKITDGPKLTSCQSVGATENRVVTYAALFACLLELVDF